MKLNILLAAAEATGGKEQNLYQTLLMLGMVVLFFYFILWRPEQKRRKKLDTMRKSLKKGDTVIAMGIRATVDEVREKTVVLKQIDGARIEMVAAAITEIEGAPSSSTEPSSEKNS